MISRETIDKIFETARIEEVIGDFVTLKKSGGNFKGLSPFSNEKTPSFMVSPAKQIFKDFSSGKGGNVVSFLMEHEHYTYPEALRFLAKKYNIEIEETGQSDEEKELRSERESLFLVNDFANRFFQESLWKTEEGKSIGLSYFHERRMTDEIIRTFQLGYCPESGTALTDAALKESYQLEFLEKTGLTKVDGPRKRDRFWGRVIFPILSHTGRVLGFGGRVLKKDAKTAKYLNSPESEIYHKSKTLYGLFQAKAHLSKEDECLLVEGYTDVISLYQAGVKNAVASSGTSLTTDQINLIKRYTQNITILYDGDSAGIKASLRGIDMILEEGLNVQVLLFPDGEDPDSYAHKVSSAELRDYIHEEKQDFLRFKASLLLKEAGDNPLEKSRAAREIVQSIALIPDALQRDAYVKECARVLEVDEKVLFSELAQIRKSKQKQERKRPASEEPTRMEVVQADQADLEAPSGTYKQEEALCWLLLNYGQKICSFEVEGEEVEESVAEHIITELVTDHLKFDNTAFQKILEEYTRIFDEEERVLSSEDLLRNEDNELLGTVVDLVSEKYELHNWQSRKIFLPEKDAFIPQYTRQSVLRFKEKKISLLITDVQQKFHKEESESRENQLQMLTRLTQLRIKINKELGRVV
ncbi:MAG TPA: DNA primase [Cryomorphaceae bacterium]|nr:DNA primase [Owenweeksia sp.]MBF99455.1 DNA primase [Owenweeksia sp.]HAD95958.1 DNA primase [Cryomorphaceae bacterium]HBF19965.1 DNA primase [Cryomorphaceae bacterium]|tara:strand:+ start:4481 stop:6403 length:1923 start_codon:yes stop_codon:yes gene_type:complete